MKKSLKAAQTVCGIVYSLAIIVIVLVTAFDISVYGDLDYFEAEYEKYDVLSDLDMEMDDVMEVTRHMMSYLRGNEDSLQITTVVDGERQDFFNDQDLFHMAEVRDIFVALYRMRIAAVVLLVLALAVLIATKAGIRRIFRYFQFCLVAFLAVAAVLGIIVAVNFSQAFVVFHHIFFNNDQWLFDPNTDLMINMLPEGLFMDFTVKILVCFVLLLAVVELILAALRAPSRRGKKKAAKEKAKAEAAAAASARKMPHYENTAEEDEDANDPGGAPERAEEEKADNGSSGKGPGAGKILSLLLVFCLASSLLSPVSEAAGARREGDASVQTEAAGGQSAAFSSGLPDRVNLTGLSGWPEQPAVEADAAILIDARTGNILYAKDVNTAYYPASITKILTALIVCEQGNPQDTLTFSHNAIFSIPSDSSIAGFSEGEQVSVEDALYGLMLASGNEVAVALAEYISGSVEDFALLMNERAAEAGALNSNFVNPHGYTDPDHYTTAYDMAMIMRAAVQNEEFLKIASTVTYTIPATNKNEDGYTFTAGHQMINKNRDAYYEYAVAGKTGFTSQAGNTLVTYAKKGDTELICVIMHSNGTHYSDTKTVLDYGFNNFTTYNVASYDSSYNSQGVGFFRFLSPAFQSAQVTVETEDCYVTVPQSVSFDEITARMLKGEELAEVEDESVLGIVIYEYEGLEVGRTSLRLVTGAGAGEELTGQQAGEENETEEPVTEEGETEETEKPQKVITVNVWYIAGGVILLIVLVIVIRFLLYFFSAKQRRKRKIRHARQLQHRYTGAAVGSGGSSPAGRAKTRSRKRRRRR